MLSADPQCGLVCTRYGSTTFQFHFFPHRTSQGKAQPWQWWKKPKVLRWFSVCAIHHLMTTLTLPLPPYTAPLIGRPHIFARSYVSVPPLKTLTSDHKPRFCSPLNPIIPVDIEEAAVQRPHRAVGQLLRPVVVFLGVPLGGGRFPGTVLSTRRTSCFTLSIVATRRLTPRLLSPRIHTDLHTH